MVRFAIIIFTTTIEIIKLTNGMVSFAPLSIIINVGIIMNLEVTDSTVIVIMMIFMVVNNITKIIDYALK